MPKTAKRSPVPSRRNACSNRWTIPVEAAGSDAAPGSGDRSGPLQANGSTRLPPLSGGFPPARRLARLPRGPSDCKPLRWLTFIGFFSCFHLVAAALGARAAPPLDAESLLRRFAATPGLTARFEEEKHLALLRAPLVSDGAIYFAPPDKLARHVVRPSPSTLVIRGTALTLTDGAGTRSLDLSESPIARAFVDTLRMLLTGDFAALRAAHEIELSAAAEPWQLRLRPRTAPLLGAIDRIEVGGAGDTIAEIRIVEAGGDETRTRFSEVDAAHAFSPSELERLFPNAAP